MSSVRPDAVPVLITRPEPGAAEMEALLRERCSSACPFRAPLTRIEGTGRPPPPGSQALLFTSPRAPAFAAALSHLPAYAVGESTARAASKAGFRVLGRGNEKVDASLAEAIPEQISLLHVSGEDIATDPEPLLRARKIDYRRHVAYRAVETDRRPAGMDAFLRTSGRKAVTFMSARAAAAYLRLMREGPETSGGPPLAICASGRIAEVLSGSASVSGTVCAPSPKLSGFVDFTCSRCT